MLEVKVFDFGRPCGGNRIVEGFHQIVSCANDYNKPPGYKLL
ncbi:hypothetical protein [Gloeobacter morelensis]|nr:hypothetical protein [Gloeobacter morelensis]